MTHETIVVDNGSPGSAVSAVCDEFEFARAIRSEKNLGFSRAVNRAAGEATTGVLVLVNDDARYDPEFVARLTAALDPGAGVAMAAGVLRREAREDLIDTAGIAIDRTLLGFDHLHGEPLAAATEATAAPFGPSGAAAAYDRAAFERLGGFDERIFAYFEDLDLALRMRLAGLDCRLVPGAGGVHRQAATLGRRSARKDYLMGFARGYLLRKWGVLSAGSARGDRRPRRRDLRRAGAPGPQPGGRARPAGRMASGFARRVSRATIIDEWADPDSKPEPAAPSPLGA